MSQKPNTNKINSTKQQNPQLSPTLQQQASNQVTLEPLDMNKSKILQQITNEILNTKTLDLQQSQQYDGQQLPDALQQSSKQTHNILHLSPLMSTRHNKNFKLQVSTFQNSSMENLPTLKNLQSYPPHQQIENNKQYNANKHTSSILQQQQQLQYQDVVGVGINQNNMKDSSPKIESIKNKTKQNKNLPPLDNKSNQYQFDNNDYQQSSNKLPSLTSKSGLMLMSDRDEYNGYATNRPRFSNKNSSNNLNYSTLDYTQQTHNQKHISPDYDKKLESKEFELNNPFKQRKLKIKYETDIHLPEFLPQITMSRSPQNLFNKGYSKNKFSQSMIEITEEEVEPQSSQSAIRPKVKAEIAVDQIEIFEDEYNQQSHKEDSLKDKQTQKQRLTLKNKVGKASSNNLPSKLDIINLQQEVQSNNNYNNSSQVVRQSQLQQKNQNKNYHSKQIQQQRQSSIDYNTQQQQQQQQQSTCLFPSI